MHCRIGLLLAAWSAGAIGLGVTNPAPRRGPSSLSVFIEEFVFTSAPFPSAHASTIVETPSGLVAAWFGGTREKHPDVGIWLSRHIGGAWTAPAEVVNGVQADGRRFPCWNPVLYRTTAGALWLFYKVGPSPSTWWALVMRSDDDGRTWSTGKRLPEGILGPIRAKPVQLADGTLLAGWSTEDSGWRVHMERTRDPAGSWEKTPPLESPPTFSAIQPTILVHDERRIQILCRTEQGVIAESWSDDGGRAWSAMQRTELLESERRDRRGAPRGRAVPARLQSDASRQAPAADRDLTRRPHLDAYADARRQSG